MKSVKLFYNKYNSIIKYFTYSCISTLADVLIVRTLFYFFNVSIVLSNTIGVVCGFIISYILSSKRIFNAEVGMTSFLIYFGTFILGLILSNFIIDKTYCITIRYLPEKAAFWNGKCVSVVIPFFVMYYIRKKSMNKLTEVKKKWVFYIVIFLVITKKKT